MEEDARTLPPPLAAAALALARADPRIAQLPHVVDLVSAWLDRTVLATPVDAAASRHVRLFDRVVARVANDPLQDPNIRDFWLEQAMRTAVENDDLRMVQRIHRLLPQPLAVHTLQLVLQHASLAMVQWLIANRCDAMCSGRPGVHQLCRACLRAALEKADGDEMVDKVLWFVAEGVVADPLDRHLRSRLTLTKEMVRWCHDHGLLHPNVAAFAIEKILNRGDTSTVAFLLDKNYTINEFEARQCLFEASCRDDDATVQFMLARGLGGSLQCTETRPGGRKVVQLVSPDTAYDYLVAKDLVLTASMHTHLETLQWLHKVFKYAPNMATLIHSANDEAKVLSVYEWMRADRVAGFPLLTMDKAAEKGFLRVVQWLHANSITGCSTNAMDMAATNGHLDLVRWLHEHRTEGCTDAALGGAATNGHLPVVQWLHEHRSLSDVTNAMACAADHGHFDVVRWLHEADLSSCGTCALRALLAQNVSFGTPSPSVLRWLHERGRAQDRQGHCFKESAACATRATVHRYSPIDGAAFAGNLALLKSLYDHEASHPDLFAAARASRFMEPTAHTNVMAWLHEHHEA